ncbi:MAG: hypothetical protein E6I87_13815 [Chloroflexi bacterium]|nr:MAG: hypothetical protein E6I87_13815 [Chloroflexota bacterium]
MTQEQPPAGAARPRRRSITAFVAGFVGAIVFNFLLLFLTASTLGGLGQNPSAVVVLASWLVTIALLAALYRLHPWSAYGALAGYAGLFALLLFFGGIFGPWSCFSPYGYPRG